MARYHIVMAIPRKRLRTIGADIEKIVKPILNRRGFGATTIVNSWVDVVGLVLAKHIFPEKISYPGGSRLGGTLHLRINSSAVALELQHLAPQLKDKINNYREVTGQKTALICATGKISNLKAVAVCFNPKFGGGRFGPAENEHFLKAANFAIKVKVVIWLVIFQSSVIDVHTGVT